MNFGSLRLRLLLAGALSITLALALAAAGLTLLFERHAERRCDAGQAEMKQCGKRRPVVGLREHLRRRVLRGRQHLVEQGVVVDGDQTDVGDGRQEPESKPCDGEEGDAGADQVHSVPGS